jgi:hypothetical protein
MRFAPPLSTPMLMSMLLLISSPSSLLVQVAECPPCRFLHLIIAIIAITSRVLGTAGYEAPFAGPKLLNESCFFVFLFSFVLKFGSICSILNFICCVRLLQNQSTGTSVGSHSSPPFALGIMVGCLLPLNCGWLFLSSQWGLDLSATAFVLFADNLFTIHLF